MKYVFCFMAIAAAILIFLSSGNTAFLRTYAQQLPGDIDHSPLLKGLSDLPNLSSKFQPNLSPLFKELNISDMNSSVPLSGSAVSEVSGTYKNDIVGFQIDLPTGWSGKLLNFMVDTVIASPKGNQSESGALRPDTFMTISGIDSAAFQKLADLAKGMGQDLTSFSNGSISCKVVSSSPTSINGIPAEEIMKDCNHGGIVVKGKAYVLGTQDNSIIVIGFTSRSNRSFEKYLPLFEDSVKTLKISKPGDISKSEAYKKFKERQSNVG